MKTLVILAHSDLKNASIANKLIINKLKTVKDLEIRDLYQLYPEFKIDIEAEQQAMIHADVVLFQYPFHWYNMPGILKEWIDRVFVRGFAYGPEKKLSGKEFFVSTTIGGPEGSYKKGGGNNFTVRELLKPLEQTAYFTGMTFHKPIVSHSMVFIPGGENPKEEIEQRAANHADAIIAFINELAIQYDHL